MNKFSPSTIEELMYYVYIYSDPDTGEPFYVGKGKGNRVFSHLDTQDNSEKSKKIKAIRRRGEEPVIEILSHGLDEKSALYVEAAVIDMIGIDNLTNKQRGIDSALYGRVEAELLEARYNREELSIDDIEDNLILIRINQTYESDMSDLELYECTRGYWKLNVDRARTAEYAAAVYEGVILEVYKIATWLPAGSTYMDSRDTRKIKGRYEFVGTIAPERIREKYINKSVTEFFAQGNTNPIKYEGPDFW